MLRKKNIAVLIKAMLGQKVLQTSFHGKFEHQVPN